MWSPHQRNTRTCAQLALSVFFVDLSEGNSSVGGVSVRPIDGDEGAVDACDGGEVLLSALPFGLHLVADLADVWGRCERLECAFTCVTCVSAANESLRIPSARFC